MPPRILSYGPDGLPLARGVRIPLLLISPYARAGAVSHAEGDHNAVIETINAIFGLPALSSLPDGGGGARRRQFADVQPVRARPGFQQKYLGPRDTNSPITDSLLSGFSPKRLTRRGRAAAGRLMRSIPERDASTSLPHYGGKGCAAIGVTPDRPNAHATRRRSDFNTLPSTLPAYNNSETDSGERPLDASLADEAGPARRSKRRAVSIDAIERGNDAYAHTV